MEQWSRITDSVANTCCHVSLVAINELTAVVKAFKTRLERVSTPLAQQLGLPGTRAEAAVANLVKLVRSEFGTGRVAVWWTEVEHYLRQACAGNDEGDDSVTLKHVLQEVLHIPCLQLFYL